MTKIKKPSKEELYMDYVINKISPDELAKKYGYSHNSSIYDLLNKYNIVERINFKIDKEILSKHYLEENLTLKEIGAIYNCSASKIDKLIKSYNIPRRGKAIPKIQLIEFSEEQLQIIRGTLLGDAYMTIPKGSTNPNLSIEHSTIQEDYTIWLHKLLSPFALKLHNRIVKSTIHNGRTIRESSAIRFRLSCHKSLHDIYSSYYPQGKKVITKEILDCLTPLGIAVWFMDDGIKFTKALELCTGDLDENTQRVIVSWFNEKYDFNCRYRYLNDSGYRIVFNKKDSIKLANIMKSHFCPSMLYKIEKLI